MRYVSWIIVLLLTTFAFFLRVYKVDAIPPGLYIDEVSIGLNAYDIVTTGKDQYGQTYPMVFAAYGEYKMPMYIYLVSIAMRFLGKTEFAIRLPSVLFGSLTIGVFFLLVKEILERELKKKQIILSLSTVGATIFAISPWHLQFSRAGFEATVALFFYSCAILSYLFFWKRKQILYFPAASLFLLLTFYTYDGYRLIVPITFVGSWIIFWVKNLQRKKITTISVFLGFGLLPLVLFTLTGAGIMRFSQTSAFSENHFPNILQQILADIIVYVRNYFSFFSLTFLFRFGDQINRHHIQEFGLLYIWQLPFIISGLIFLPQIKTMVLKYGLSFLLLIAPLTAAFTIPSPHSLRYFMAIIPLTTLTVTGIYYVFLLLKKRKLIRLGVGILTIFLVVIQFIYYLDYYYVHYPKSAIYDWGGECKQTVQEVKKLQKDFDKIYIDTYFMCVHDYFSFYSPDTNVFYVDIQKLSKREKSGRTLLIKHKNENTLKGEIIDRVYIPNLNHDVFAEFWRI